MRRREFLGTLCGCGAALGAGAALGESLAPKLSPGFRPEASSAEGGLWDQFAREERKLRHSPYLLRNPELEAYIQGIACRVIGDYCRDVRVFLVRMPFFNAFMAPNGLMQVWSGALLRCQSEAQIAAVIGHECGHYLRRHGVERFADAQDKSSISTLLGMAMSAARLGWLSATMNGVVLATSAAFTRDQEREADAIGMDLCAAAGYDPEEAANVWAYLVAERKARDDPGFRDLIFATHPVEEEREETLRARAKGLEGGGLPERRFRDRYLRALRSERSGFFADELQLRSYGASIALFERMLADEPRDLEVAFNLGEVYRMRAREGDGEQALRYYGLAADGGPPETWRSMGLVRRARHENAEALEAFRKYLEAKPDADDAAMIRTYIDEARAT